MDGLTVMRRGHAPDPRVTAPAVQNALGAPPDALPSRELYFALWCAARAVAAGGDGLGVVALLNGPPASAEPRSLGDLMATGMADVLALPEHQLGRRWAEYELKLAKVLEVLGPHQGRVQALTLAAIKARLHGGTAGDLDRLDLARRGGPLPQGEAVQLVRGQRSVGLIAIPTLAERGPTGLGQAVVAQAERLPLRDALSAAGCWSSPGFWLVAAGAFCASLTRAESPDLRYAKAALRKALTSGLQAKLAARLDGTAPAAAPAADPHDQALARLAQSMAREARDLTANLGPPPCAPARPEPRPRSALWGQLALPILMYHRVATNPAPGLGRYCVSPDDFEAQLAHLRREGYASVGPDELLQFLRFEAPLPARSVMLTFDDGYEDFATEAWPRLRRYGFSAVVFAVTGRVGRGADWDADQGAAAPLMDWRRLRELAAQGVAIESHSDTHQAMPHLPLSSVYREALRSRAILAEAIGRAPTAFCYPFGAHDPATERALEECGYSLALTTQHGACALGGSAMRIPRIEVAGSDNLEVFARKVRVAA